MPEIKPWDKQPYERDYNLFQDFLLFDGTLEEFAEENGISNSKISKVSAKNKWRPRKQEYREYQSTLARQQREQQLLDHQKKEYEIIEITDEIHLELVKSLKKKTEEKLLKESTVSFTMKNISDSRRLNNQLAYLLAGKSDSIPPEQVERISVSHEISPRNSPDELRRRIDEKLARGSQKIKRKEVYDT